MLGQWWSSFPIAGHPIVATGGSTGFWLRWSVHGRLSSITGSLRAHRPTKNPSRLSTSEHVRVKTLHAMIPIDVAFLSCRTFGRLVRVLLRAKPAEPVSGSACRHFETGCDGIEPE